MPLPLALGLPLCWQRLSCTPRFQRSQLHRLTSVLSTAPLDRTRSPGHCANGRHVRPTSAFSKKHYTSLPVSGNFKLLSTSGNHEARSFRCYSGSSPLASSATSTDATSGSVAVLPKNAKVVVCGGGAIGCSVAFHLAKEGWTDVVLLEQGR